MGKVTGIAWTDHTWNPWWGCVKVSPGCTNCYAESWDARWKGGHWGKDAPRRFFGEAHWREPLKWNDAAARAGKRARVFCASMADVFEDRSELEGQRGQLWDLIRDTPRLDWQLLTKRPENVRRMLPPIWLHEPMPNVWIGTTVEDQKRADERIPELLKVPAKVRFLSCEPLLGPVEIRFEHDHRNYYNNDGIRWVIVGGESGSGARPMHTAWARTLIAQCKAAGVACFVKQLGQYPQDGIWTKRMSDSHGSDPAEWPADLRVREFPHA